MAAPTCPEGYVCSFTPSAVKSGPELPWYQSDLGLLFALALILGATICICYIYYWHSERISKRESRESQERA